MPYTKAMVTLGLCLALANTLLDDIIGDTSKPHESAPRGVGAGVDWGKGPRLGYGTKMPADWKAFVVWGQVYEPVDGSLTVNTRVELRNIQALILSKKTGKWQQVQHSKKVQGSYYREDFKDDINDQGTQLDGPEGGVSVKTSPGFNYHFWTPKGRIELDREDIAGVYTACEARLVREDVSKADDRAKARFMLSMGADYWKAVDSQWDQFKTNGDVMIGRFRFIKSDWGWHHACTLSAEALRKNPPPMPTRER